MVPYLTKPKAFIRVSECFSSTDRAKGVENEITVYFWLLILILLLIHSRKKANKKAEDVGLKKGGKEYVGPMPEAPKDEAEEEEIFPDAPADGEEEVEEEEI